MLNERSLLPKRPRGAKARYACEICHVKKLFSNENTVCEACDEWLATSQAHEMEMQAKEWTAKHSCRRCKKGLPVGRYFECEVCLPEWAREGAFEWDAVPSFGPDEDKFIPPSAVPLAKPCRSCSVTKPIAEYTLVSRYKDGHNIHCRACVSNKYMEKKLSKWMEGML